MDNTFKGWSLTFHSRCSSVNICTSFVCFLGQPFLPMHLLPLSDLMRRQEELRRLEELRNQELQRRKQLEMRSDFCIFLQIIRTEWRSFHFIWHCGACGGINLNAFLFVRHEEERRRREEEMIRHREQELRRQSDGFKPNYLDNVSTTGRRTKAKNRKENRPLV